MRVLLIVLPMSMLGACAGTSEMAAEGGGKSNTQYALEGSHQASLTPASGLEVCNPTVVDRRAPLATGCLNRIEHAPTTGKQYEAVGREIKEQPNLCDQMWLPRCRRKY